MEPLMWLIVLAVFLVIEVNHGRTDYDLVCRRRTGRSDCVRRRCRYTGAVDPVFSHFTGPADFYKTTGSSIYE